MAPNNPRSLRRVFSFGSTRPSSPTFSESTNVSAMNLGANGPSKIISRANLKASVQAYEDLVASCSTYRAALVAMSNATASFADAMERCSGMKGPAYEAATRLQAASGLHHLMGNLWQVLSDTLDTKVEKPLREHLASYRTVVQERTQNYEHTLKEKSRAIRNTETQNLNHKRRNLQTFREALSTLQRQIDELDELKISHYQEIMDHEEKVWDGVQSQVCLAVRSTMDVFDRITSKASDPIIEPMLQTVPDPFDSYGPPQSEDQIFSILAPLSIMSPSPSPSPVVGTPEGIDHMGNHGLGPEAQSHAHSSYTYFHYNKITSWLPSALHATHPPNESPTSRSSGSASPIASPPNGRSSSPITPASPPQLPTASHSISPPASGFGFGRRHTLPNSPPSRAGVVKVESKLRSSSTLASIEELRDHANAHVSARPTAEIPISTELNQMQSGARDVEVAPTRSRPSEAGNGTPNSPAPALLINTALSSTRAAAPPQLVNAVSGIWDYEYGQSSDDHDGDMTPRNSILFPSPLSQPVHGMGSATKPPQEKKLDYMESPLTGDAVRSMT